MCVCQMINCSEPRDCDEKFCQHHLITECYNEENEKLKERSIASSESRL